MDVSIYRISIFLAIVICTFHQARSESDYDDTTESEETTMDFLEVSTVGTTPEEVTGMDETTVEDVSPCDDNPTICTDQNFINCIDDGEGDYHCENCTDGYDLEDGECVVYKTLRGQFTLTSIDGVDAVYTAELADPTSAEFTELADEVCEQITLALVNDSSTTVYDCDVLEFQSGSIIVIYALTLDNNTAASTDDIVDTLVTNLTIIGYLGLDASSFTLTDVCDGVNCKNGGYCRADENFDAECICSDGYEGEFCGREIGETRKLSVPAIIGIAIGCTVFVLLIVIIVIVICKCMSKSSKVGASSAELLPSGEERSHRSHSQGVHNTVEREEEC